MAHKEPNERLNSWFTRSGWSKGELARRVNRRAQQLGVFNINTDTSRVRRWLDGEQPRDPIPRILAELFSERFGCVMTAEELGLREARAVHPANNRVNLPWTGVEALTALGDFARSDLMIARPDRMACAVGLVVGPALVEPLQRWLAPSPAPPPALPGAQRPGQLSLTEIEQLEATVVVMREWDERYGGGVRRKAVVGQLAEVTDLLPDAYPPEPARRLAVIAAQLATLAGWMSYDIGLQGAAQQYLVLALHTAKLARDRPLGAHALAAMSRQLVHAGRAQDALELIHLAQYGCRGLAGPSCQAKLYAVEARAYAGLGQVQQCRRALTLAEEALGKRRGESEPEWSRGYTLAELTADAGFSHRDLAYRLPEHAEEARALLASAVELSGKSDLTTRSHVLNLIGLASTYLLSGEPEPMCATVERALELMPRLRSERACDRLRRTMAAASRQYGKLAAVAELADRVALALPEA